MRRTKILILCQGEPSVSECVDEWHKVLQDETKGVKKEETRVTTPYAIMDFVSTKPIFCKEYPYILPENISSEKVLTIAIGKQATN